MKIISANRPVFADGKHGVTCYRPFCRYIVSDYEHYYLTMQARETQWTTSSFNPYERRPGPGVNLNGKKVCIYRHTAFGDQLMISAVPRYLKTLYPEAIVHLYCDPGIVDMWKNNPFVDGAAIPIPIPFDVARAYDYHIFYEGMLENNGEHDQNNCYDDFFGFAGFSNVPDKFKRPWIQVKPEDYKFVSENKIDLTGKYMVFHTSPANKNRAYPPDQGLAFINMFIQHPDFEDWRVILVGKSEHGIEYKVSDPRIIDLVDKTKSFRDLIPIMEKAALFIGPDSSVMHLAACFPETVSISLWGLFHPNDRAKYYPNHHYLFRPEVCKEAPCHDHNFSLPLHMCKKSVGWVDGSQYCRALSAITPADIMDEVERVLL